MLNVCIYHNSINKINFLHNFPKCTHHKTLNRYSESERLKWYLLFVTGPKLYAAGDAANNPEFHRVVETDPTANSSSSAATGSDWNMRVGSELGLRNLGPDQWNCEVQCQHSDLISTTYGRRGRASAISGQKVPNSAFFLQRERLIDLMKRLILQKRDMLWRCQVSLSSCS